MSKFLPKDFKPNEALAIIAGKGMYPKILKDELDKNKINNVLIAFEGETPAELWEKFPEEKRWMMNVGQLGKLLKSLKQAQVKYAIMAGQITPKKLFKGMKPDLKAIMILARLKRKNAETIFGAIANEMLSIGVELLDARAFMDDSIAPAGFLVGKSWGLNKDYIEHAMHIARESARLDIGQGCVTSRGSVLAVEAFEGTDLMLERAGSFDAKDCIFAKTVKVNQDYRFDVPVIGTRTIENLAKANINNVLLEAGKVIVLEIDEVKKLAEKNDIKIFGL